MVYTSCRPTSSTNDPDTLRRFNLRRCVDRLDSRARPDAQASPLAAKDAAGLRILLTGADGVVSAREAGRSGCEGDQLGGSSSSFLVSLAS